MTFCTCADGRGLLQLSFTQHSDNGTPEVLELCLKAIGFGKIYGPYETGHPSKKYTLLYTSSEAILVFEMLYPKMGSVKQAQGDKAIEAFKLYKQHRRTVKTAAQMILPMRDCGAQGNTHTRS